jgi:biotin carboxyl carrier protein
MGTYSVLLDGKTFTVALDLPAGRGGEFQVRVGEETLRVRIPSASDVAWILVNDRPYELHLDAHGHRLQTRSGVHEVEVHDRDTARGRPASADGRIKAPIPGTIARLLVAPGDAVSLGQPLLVLEAMKMENEVRATRAGTVSALHVAPGQVVKRGELLAEVS